MPEVTLEAYKAMVGKEVGVSRWFDVPQARIDRFADVTEDHQFIHVDPERAKATPFGGTVAHGFLTMSLLAPMAFDGQPMHTFDSACVRLSTGGDPAGLPHDTLMNPESVGEAYWMLHQQPRDAWTFELDLRPYCESW